jgi:CheY-like chemotaxis protein
MGKPRPRILDVGQCNFDHSNICRTLTYAFDVDVDLAHTAGEAMEAVKSESYDLILVNRILDADSSPGLDLIRLLTTDAATRKIPVMLISNYAEAQDTAVTLGAGRGFGKDELDSPAPVDRLSPILVR